MKNLSLLSLLLFITSSLFGQKVLSLKQAIDLAQANSNYVKIAGKTLEIERANFKSFQTDLRPQMMLQGVITSYSIHYTKLPGIKVYAISDDLVKNITNWKDSQSLGIRFGVNLNFGYVKQNYLNKRQTRASQIMEWER